MERLKTYLCGAVAVSLLLSGTPAHKYELTAPQEIKPQPNAVVLVESNYLIERAAGLDGSVGGECVYFVQKFLGRLDDCEKRDCNAAKFRGAAENIKPNAAEARIGSAVLLQYNLGHTAAVIDIDGNDLVLAESNMNLDGKVKIGRRVSMDDPRVRGYYDFRIEDLETYFKERSMPLATTSRVMVETADRYGLDWRLLPALAVRESSGGKLACGYNPFGWASCKGEVGRFDSWNQAIETVARALAEGDAYAGKDLRAKLETYNPVTIVPTYANEVIEIMAKIGPNPAGMAQGIE